MKTIFISRLKNTFLFVLNLLAINQIALAQSYQCDIPLPQNFLSRTNASGTTVNLSWQPVSQATGGYRIEVYNLSTGRRHFQSTVGQSVTTASVSVNPAHHYMTSVRGICGSGGGARLGLKANIGTASKIITDDVIFSPCEGACPGLANANYGNVAGAQLSWTGPIWGGGAAAFQVRRRNLYLQFRRTDGSVGAGEKIRVTRDDGNMASVHYNDVADNCRNNVQITADLLINGVRCTYLGEGVAMVLFHLNDDIDVIAADGWEVRYTTVSCNLSPFTTPEAGGGDDFETFDGANAVSRVQPLPNATELLCSPNPSVETIEINFQLAEDEEVTLDIYAPLGELVKSISPSEKFFSGKNSLSADVAALPPGVYFAVLRGASWQSAVRFEKI